MTVFTSEAERPRRIIRNLIWYTIGLISGVLLTLSGESRAGAFIGNISANAMCDRTCQIGLRVEAGPDYMPGDKAIFAIGGIGPSQTLVGVPSHTLLLDPQIWLLTSDGPEYDETPGDGIRDGYSDSWCDLDRDTPWYDGETKIDIFTNVVNGIFQASGFEPPYLYTCQEPGLVVALDPGTYHIHLKDRDPGRSGKALVFAELISSGEGIEAEAYTTPTPDRWIEDFQDMDLISKVESYLKLRPVLREMLREEDAVSLIRADRGR